jgi:thiamine pyrophosphate-dependent acetolactate synthase large subunit-like protein
VANTVADILVDRLIDWGVRTIFSLPGDGINGIFEALRTRSNEIQLIQVKYRLPIKIIVVKNNVLGMIKWEQLAMEGTPQYGVQLQPIDFVAIARACGAEGYSVDDPRLVPDVLREAFQHPGPAVIEAIVDPNEPPLPGRFLLIKRGNSPKRSRGVRKTAGTSSKPSWKIECVR